MITTAKGNVLVMINDYTFSKLSLTRGFVWACSGRTMNQCKAKIRLEKDHTISSYNLDHNHPPPSFHITKDGKYIRL